MEMFCFSTVKNMGVLLDSHNQQLILLNNKSFHTPKNCERSHNMYFNFNE